MLLFVALICLASASYYVGEIVTAPSRERRNLLTRATHYGRMRVIHGRELPRFRDRVLGPTITKLAALMLKINPRTSIASVSAKLMAAGLRTTSPLAFLAAEALFGLVGFVFGVAFASSMGGMRGLLFVVVLTAMGFFGPTYFVVLRARRRQESVSADLPDALDLLAVSVEAGLGFDGAIAKLTEHMEGDLIDEFEMALSEMRVGENRAEALKRM